MNKFKFNKKKGRKIRKLNRKFLKIRKLNRKMNKKFLKNSNTHRNEIRSKLIFN
jgi:hypothetical protein